MTAINYFPEVELTAHGETVKVRRVIALPARWEITHNGAYVFSDPSKSRARQIALAYLERYKPDDA